MPSETPTAQVADASPRALPRPIAYACALFVAVAAVVLAGTSDAAAADDLGDLVAGTVGTVDTVDAVPLDQAAAPIVEALEPATDELPPIDPIEPIDPITPIIDGILPIIEPITSADMPLIPPGSPLQLEPAPPVAAGPDLERTTPQPTHDVPVSVTGGLDASARTDSTSPAQASTGLPFELPVPASSPLAAGGTMLVAALLIGLLMAAPTAWTVSALGSGLRPLSLAHSPPVPPA
jgi:hypothetical protein